MWKRFLIIMLIVLILPSAGCSKSSSNIKKYLDSGTLIDLKAKDFMPNLNELPKYENISYKYTHKSMIIFESDSVALIVNYDDKTYNNEKDKLAKKYVFLDHRIRSDNDWK